MTLLSKIMKGWKSNCLTQHFVILGKSRLVLTNIFSTDQVSNLLGNINDKSISIQYQNLKTITTTTKTTTSNQPNKQIKLKYSEIPRPLLSSALRFVDDASWNLTLIPHLLGSQFLLVFKYANESNLTFSAYLTTWPQMTNDLSMRPLT